MREDGIGKIYGAHVATVCRLRAEAFFGRKFAVCFANPQLSFVAKRQKVQMQSPAIFPLRAKTFSINFVEFIVSLTH